MYIFKIQLLVVKHIYLFTISIMLNYFIVVLVLFSTAKDLMIFKNMRYNFIISQYRLKKLQLLVLIYVLFLEFS